MLLEEEYTFCSCVSSQCVCSFVKYLLVGQLLLLLYLFYYRIDLSSAATMTLGAEPFPDLAEYYYATTTKCMDKSTTFDAFVASCDADRPLANNARNVAVFYCLNCELCVTVLTSRVCLISTYPCRNVYREILETRYYDSAIK